MKKLFASIGLFAFLLSSLLLHAAQGPIYLRAYQEATVTEGIPEVTAGGAELLAPADKALLPLLSKGQKDYIHTPRTPRVKFFADYESRKAMQALGYYPLTVTFQWKAQEGATGYLLLISENAAFDGVQVVSTKAPKAEIGNFKIATAYYWKVVSLGLNKVSAASMFTTESETPRLVRVDGIYNVRDLGGYIGRDGRRVRQGVVYRTAGLNNNASTKYADVDWTLPENAALKTEKDARMAMVTKLRTMAYSKKYKANALPCAIGKNWKVFLPGPDAKQDDIYRAFLALKEIPAEFQGVVAKDVTANEKDIVVLTPPTKEAEKYPAFLMQEFEAPADGVMQVGCGGDWFWAMSINGEPLWNVIKEGNGGSTLTKQDNSLAMPVKKGKNLVSVVLINGTLSWVWACGDLAKPVSAEQLLFTTYRAERTRVNRMGRKAIGMEPGQVRLNDEMKAYMTKTLGIRSDIDLRSDNECYGMTGSPMGEAATWFHYSSSAYGGMAQNYGKEAFKKVFEVFLDPKNYPIDFHCIAGQDRTGAVAFIVNGLLGVEEEKLYLDWEVTGFWNPDHNFNHAKRFNNLVAVFQKLPGKTLNEKIEKYVLDLGFTIDQINAFREFMLEPVQK